MASNVYWFLIQGDDTPPTSIYPYPRFEETTVKICPQTVKLQKRILYVDMAFDLEIIRDESNQYIYKSKDIKPPFITQKNPVLGEQNHSGDSIIHIGFPYVFLSDNKNLEANLLSPDYSTKHRLGNTKFIEGIIPVGRYGRSLDVAIRVSPMEHVHLFKGEILQKIVFNDEINLIHIHPTDKILKYLKSIHQVTSYTKGVKDIFKRAALTYPYKELEKCEKISDNR